MSMYKMVKNAQKRRAVEAEIDAAITGKSWAEARPILEGFSAEDLRRYLAAKRMVARKTKPERIVSILHDLGDRKPVVTPERLEAIRTGTWVDVPSLRPEEVPQSLKDKYAGMACTLDGEPGKIVNRLGAFARVLSVIGATNFPVTREFSWPTVAHVMENCGGAFRS